MPPTTTPRPSPSATRLSPVGRRAAPGCGVNAPAILTSLTAIPRASGSISFLPPTRGTPTLAFIHGGYWQINDLVKENFAFFAEGVLPLGINLAVIEYTLAPAARLDRMSPRCAAPCDGSPNILVNTAPTRTAYTFPAIRPAVT